jgi:aryl-alcohol dehydrogenase-like predicted oxidoreductase
VPIPGTTRLHRLDENIGADAIGLTSDEARELEVAASRITIHGDRYGQADAARTQR